MIRRSLLAAGLACAAGLGLLGLPHTARATTFAETTETQRIDRADLIVRGTVVEQWVEADPSGRLYTRVMVDVAHTYKGAVPDGRVVVTQPGGELGGVRTLVDGTARFNVGEDVVLLLQEKAHFGDFVLISMIKGKYTVRLEPHSRREVVQQTWVPPHLEWDHRFLPFANQSELHFLADLEASIADRVELPEVSQ